MSPTQLTFRLAKISVDECSFSCNVPSSNSVKSMFRCVLVLFIVAFHFGHGLLPAAELRPLRGTVNVPCRLYIEGDDGKFYFKLAAADGRVLLQSAAFESGRDAGQWVSRLKTDGAAALGEAPVSRSDGVSAQDVSAALAALAAQ